MVKPRSDSPWKQTGEALDLLNVSADWLYSMLPYWNRDHHWRNIQRPTAAKPRYQWHVKHIEEWLSQDASRRG